MDIEQRILLTFDDLVSDKGYSSFHEKVSSYGNEKDDEKNSRDDINVNSQMLERTKNTI